MDTLFCYKVRVRIPVLLSYETTFAEVIARNEQEALNAALDHPRAVVHIQTGQKFTARQKDGTAEIVETKKIKVPFVKKFYTNASFPV